jgi:hypothetical protein
MPRQLVIDNRTGPRYLASLEVRAEWEGEDGTHYVAEGMTENVGPEGALIHLQRELPNVGSRVQLRVLSEEGEKLSVVTEVLRLERNPAHPLAALQLINGSDEWRGLVWEPAAPQIHQPEDDEEGGDEEEIEETTH